MGTGVVVTSYDPYPGKVDCMEQEIQNGFNDDILAEARRRYGIAHRRLWV